MRFRLRLCALFLGAFAGLLGVVPASADHNPNHYLALGDSVAFGYSPLLDKTDADNFVGYPEVLGDLFRPRKKLANASCPGEASGGFISFQGVDNSCRPYRAFFPLHVSYTTPQLQYAVDYIRDNPRTGLVTIDIGANDLFVLQRSCGGDPNCIVAGLPDLLRDLGANLAIIYSALTQAGFSGDLVAVTYYLTDYTDPVGTFVISLINSVVAQTTQQFGGSVADGFAAFQAVAAHFGGNSCAAGLLIRLPQGGCDIHPSPAGRDLLAQTIFDVETGGGGHHH